MHAWCSVRRRPVPRGGQQPDLGTALADVPQLVKTLRLEATKDTEHYGNALSLLWDDPTRPSAGEEMPLESPA